MLIPALAAALAAAQSPIPDTAPFGLQTFAAQADVDRLIAQAKAELKPGEPLIVKPMVTIAPYKINLEYRVAVAGAAVHETQAEFFHIIDGGGTLVLGGTMEDAKRSNPTNMGGKSIIGGTARRVAPGDFFIVPPNTPHWFSAIDGKLVMMATFLPVSTAPAPAP